MIYPFGVPLLFTVTRSAGSGGVLRQFLELFISDSLPLHYPQENSLNVSSAENLIFHLDAIDSQHLLNTVCIVDLTDDIPQSWNIHKDEGGIRATEMVLRYPEIYWIFLVDQVPEEFPDNYLALYHFVCFSGLLRVVQLLDYFTCGFRTWFDATGLRSLLRQPDIEEAGEPKTKKEAIVKSKKTTKKVVHTQDSAPDTKNGHSAPFRSQTVANSLIQRAQSLSNEALTSNEGIHAALLAYEAWEILDHETYTLSLEALDIMCKMETMAECVFIGASADLPVNERIMEIDIAIKSLKNKNTSDNDISSKGALNITIKPLADTRFAAAIDEEESFLMLNGYVLYRYGYNTYVVPSLSEMKRIFGYCDGEKRVEPKVEGIVVVMEDLDLRFGDASNEMQEKLLIHTSEAEELKLGLSKRAEIFHALSKIHECHRIIVSSNKVIGSIFMSPSGNPCGTVHEKDSVELALSISKPYGGVFDDELIKRFKKTSLHARCEHRASKTTTEKWRYQRFNALSRIVDDLRQIYREYEQFEEEEIALSKVREYRWELKYRKKQKSFIKTFYAFFHKLYRSFLSKELKTPFAILESYFNWLMQSMSHIFWAIIFWIVLCASLFAVISDASFIKSFGFSALNFFGMQHGLVIKSKIIIYKNIDFGAYVFNSCLLLEAILSYTHLGIFIAYLYQKIARR